MMVICREFYTEDGVMLDSLRPSPASFGQRKRRTKGRKGDAFLGPGARRKGEPYAQVRSIEGSGWTMLPRHWDALLRAFVPDFDEKLFVTLKYVAGYKTNIL